MANKKSTKPSMQKFNFGVKINLGIFLIVAILCGFVFPKMIFEKSLPEDTNPIYTHESFIYPILYDVCPCSASEDYDYDSCAGYYACDKANITYNLNNAPEDALEAAKRDVWFETEIKGVRTQVIVNNIYLLMDLSYIIAAISLLSGLIYGIHNFSKTRE